ncbi:MAG: hypothetical protein AB7I36_09145 [Rhodospirillaceae bacterium]
MTREEEPIRAGYPRVAEVQAWLEKNTYKPPQPCTVTLHGFEVNWERMHGTFLASFGDGSAAQAFSFSMGGAAGETEIFLPMFHSPLGVPASYPAIDLNEDMRADIFAAVRRLFPKVMAFGLDRVLDREALAETRRRIESGSFAVDVGRGLRR